jgi:hypothetical protein
MMRTITFDTTIRDGIIKIPERYQSLETQNIEVILVVRESETEQADQTPKTKRSAKGTLHQYRNPDLIPKEKSVWEMAIREKHARNH